MANKKPGLTNMMAHYMTVKEQYSDCIVFYRLGDFYEMFFDDAVEVSKLLDLTLTGRDCGLEERAPMCGIPFHAADNYIAKLVAFGKKVAICEQLSQATGGKELVTRDVVRVVSNGTIIEDGLVDEKTNNFLAATYEGLEGLGVSWADITTGEFYCQEVPSFEKLLDVLLRISPSEIISNSIIFDKYNQLSDGVKSSLPPFSLFRDQAYGMTSAKKCLSVLILMSLWMKRGKLLMRQE